MEVSDKCLKVVSEKLVAMLYSIYENSDTLYLKEICGEYNNDRFIVKLNYEIDGIKCFYRQYECHEDGILRPVSKKVIHSADIKRELLSLCRVVSKSKMGKDMLNSAIFDLVPTLCGYNNKGKVKVWKDGDVNIHIDTEINSSDKDSINSLIHDSLKEIVYKLKNIDKKHRDFKYEKLVNWLRGITKKKRH